MQNSYIEQTAPDAGTLDELTVHLSDEDIREILEAVRAQDSDTVHAYLKYLGSTDRAELLAKVGEEDRRELLAMYSEAIDAETFAEMDPQLRRDSLSAMSATQVASLISTLESDDALEMIIHLDDSFQKEIIHKLSAKMRVALEEGLSFPEDSAGRLMQREVVAIPELWTVGKTIDYLRAAGTDLPEDFFDLFVIDPAYHIKGQIPLNRLIRASRAEKIQDIAIDADHTVRAEMDQEDVAHLFRRHDIVSAPVIDDGNRLLGVITIDDVVDVIDEEAQEDLLKMAGVDKGDLYRAVLSTTGTRFRWLFVNLLTAILASIVISFFDATIDEIVALAILMPIVASMGGNAGTQALTVAVRALSTHELSGTNAWRVIWKETLIGILNGTAFAVITGVVTTFWFGSPLLGLIIAAAMIVNLIVAGFFGVSIPLLLERAGSDPAVASTVFLTTVTDIVGFFAFLGLAALFLL
ncbi:MAG: magnesium transporter [Alphaproteobacteria bacterium]|nr:magnesium transporter [Alphaproteobacteria bacterium]